MMADVVYDVMPCAKIPATASLGRFTCYFVDLPQIWPFMCCSSITSQKHTFIHLSYTVPHSDVSSAPLLRLTSVPDLSKRLPVRIVAGLVFRSIRIAVFCVNIPVIRKRKRSAEKDLVLMRELNNFSDARAE